MCFDLALLAQSDPCTAVCEIGNHQWIRASEALSSYKSSSTLWTSMLYMRGANMQSSLLVLKSITTTILDYEGTMGCTLEYIALGMNI